MLALTANQNWVEWLKIAIGVATLSSIVIAYLAYKANLQKADEDRVRDRDKELVAQLQKSFHWAYDVLTDKGKEIPPKADRLNWLTSSRHILRSEQLVKQISSSIYKTVYAEVEEYWRHKFYVALSHSSLRNWKYYAHPLSEAWPENIEISSALVIVDFSNWKRGATDPTDNVDRDALINAGGGTKGAAGQGLEAYIVRMREIKIECSIPPS